MKKALFAVLGALLCMVVFAITYKLVIEKKDVSHSPDDILVMSEPIKDALMDKKAIDTDESSSLNPAPLEELPSPTPLDIEAQSVSPSPEPQPSPSPKSEEVAEQDEPEPTPSPTVEPEPPKTAASFGDKPLSGIIIGLDPGHQAKSNKELEPVAPGSSTMKAKVSSGTAGKFTGIAEHVVNLNIGLRLKSLLEEAGAKVIMTRETADVNIPNSERAKLFNVNKVDLGIRLHCNGSTDESVRGAFMLVPKDKNYPYYDECIRAAKTILEAYGEVTGLNISKGITYRDDQTGFNWCDRPIVNIEMGHMSNKEEDVLLTTTEFQKKMAQGIYEGVLKYFAG